MLDGIRCLIIVINRTWSRDLRYGDDDFTVDTLGNPILE
jgi:hypothetical protein